MNEVFCPSLASNSFGLLGFTFTVRFSQVSQFTSMQSSTASSGNQMARIINHDNLLEAATCTRTTESKTTSFTIGGIVATVTQSVKNELELGPGPDRRNPGPNSDFAG
jgi:hypothetical protein